MLFAFCPSCKVDKMIYMMILYRQKYSMNTPTISNPTRMYLGNVDDVSSFFPADAMLSSSSFSSSSGVSSSSSTSSCSRRSSTDSFSSSVGSSAPSCSISLAPENPIVGSKGTQPIPEKYTSTHE